MGAILFFFNLHEQREHPDTAAEEAEETYLVLGLMAISIPLMLGVAWVISKRQLKPLRDVLQSAQTIRDGKLDHRIETPVESDEIGQIARTINDAFASYQQALRRLDRFSLDAAHQLRNPLASIRANAEISLQQPRSAEEYQNSLGKILEESGRLSHTVDQLLMLARLDRNDLAESFEQTDIAALTRELLENYRPLLEEKSIALETALPNEPRFIRGVPRLLEQSIANLLDNAIRFTPKHGRISVQLTSSADTETLTVADSGPGIPDSLRNATVEQFGRGASRSKEGTGLGLAIAADVVRVHGGQITVKSSRMGGAEFAIVIPRKSILSERA
jgi:signal transduction histidine kinase